MKLSVYLALLQMNILIVGAAMNVGISEGDAITPLYACARAAAWASCVNFAFVVVGIISPIFQLIYQYFNFNIMHHSLHTIHFHRNVASCGGIFALLHVVLVIVQMAKDKEMRGTATIVTGGLILVGFIGAWLSGHLSRLERFSICSSLHFPLAFFGLLALFAHSFEISGVPFGSRLVLLVLVLCIVVYTLFFFFNPIQPMDVNASETAWQRESNGFLFLVLNYDNSDSIPPGSFYLIYDNKDSNLSYFHAHTFPVFSSRHRRLAFLIRCRTSERPDHVTYTQQLSLDKYLPCSAFTLPYSHLLLSVTSLT